MKRIILFIVALTTAFAASAIDITGKQIYIPQELRSNDFESDSSQWSYSRMRLTPASLRTSPSSGSAASGQTSAIRHASKAVP